MPAVAFEHVDIIFGTQTEAAIRLIEQGAKREEIIAATECVPGAIDISFAVERGVAGDQLEAGLRDPEAVNYWLLAAVVLLLIVASVLVRRWLLTTELRAEPGPPSRR